MMKQICIIGPSGTGKTDLAKYIAARYRTKYITGSSRELSSKFNIESHQDIIKLCANTPEDALSMYKSILNMREAILDDNPYNLVTDRGIIDLMIYFTIQLAPFLDKVKNELFYHMCLEIIENTGKKVIFIFTPFNYQQTIAKEGRRIINPDYQKFISNSFDVVIKDVLKDCEVITLEEWDWETRVRTLDRRFDNTKWNRFKSKIQSIWEKVRKR